ncbi:MAG: hypothetical protein AB2535_03295 [Candidatus Thiodiazotropha endolucinida]
MFHPNGSSGRQQHSGISPGLVISGRVKQVAVVQAQLLRQGLFNPERKKITGFVLIHTADEAVFEILITASPFNWPLMMGF